MHAYMSYVYHLKSNLVFSEEARKKDVSTMTDGWKEKSKQAFQNVSQGEISSQDSGIGVPGKESGIWTSACKSENNFSSPEVRMTQQ